MKCVNAILAVAMIVACSTWSKAAIIYSYVTDAPTYDAAGGTATVEVYLKETLTSPSTSFITADNGLAGAGFKVSRSAGSGILITGVAGDPALNSGFFGTIPATISPGLPTDTAQMSEFDFGSPAPTPDTVTHLLHLGTVTFTASGGATTSTFNLERYDSTGGNTVTLGPPTGDPPQFLSSHDLDFDSVVEPEFTGATGVTSFTVTVPEPATMSLVLAGSLLVLRRPSRLSLAQTAE